MTATDLLAEADKFVAGGSIATPVPLRTLVKGLANEVIRLRIDKARLLALIESCRGRCASPDVNGEG